jgi:YihY family inner membrane protein
VATVNAVERQFRRFDRFQQRHGVLGFPIAVIQKFGNDQAGGKAALIAYYGLFALFPLLLLFATITGWLLSGHPEWRNSLLNPAVANFPIVGSQLRQSAKPLGGNWFAIAVGVLGTLYGARGVGQAALNAMNSVWNVPYKDWPNFFKRQLRGYLWLVALFVATIASTTVASFGSTWLGGDIGWVWSLLAAFVINLGVFYVVFTVLTAEPLRWRDVWLGVALAAIFWQTLQALGGVYVRHSVANASDVYGFFAIVIGLLSFLFLAAQLTLLAAEVNVVLRYRLWPRSLTQPPLTEADRATFERLARMEERRPEVRVAVDFKPEADDRPVHAEPDGAGSARRSDLPPTNGAAAGGTGSDDGSPLDRTEQQEFRRSG